MQSAVTVRAEVPDAELPTLQAALAQVGRDVEAGTSALSGLGATHYARFFVMPGDPALAGGAVPASVMYMADVDGTPARHLRRLCTQAPELLDVVFSCCADYPVERDLAARQRWLAGHQVATSALYVNTAGLTADQVVAESALYEWLQVVVDERRSDLVELRPGQVHQALREAAAAEPTMAFALDQAAGEGLLERVRVTALLVLLGAAALLLLPVIVVVGLPWLLALRRLERSDPVSTQHPDLDSIQRLRSAEDQFAYNPFVATGQVKSGTLRRRTVTVLLRVIALGAALVFRRGSLAGVTTIHFARWVAIDDLRRIVFTSYYDGSLESYMNDFIDKLSWGLNLIFSNGVGYPRTRWLVFGGASDEQAFKDYLRLHQLETQVSYSAYPGLTTANIINNAAIRRDLGRDLDDATAAAWLSRL